MARVNFRVVSWNAGRVVDAVDGKLARNMRQAVALVEGEVKRSMKGGGAPHTPSRPGEPPRVDTGAYRARIFSEVDIGRRRITGRIVSPSAQARALEFGYAPGGLMARPHLRPALNRRRRDVFALLVAAGGAPSIAPQRVTLATPRVNLPG